MTSVELKLEDGGRSKSTAFEPNKANANLRTSFVRLTPSFDTWYRQKVNRPFVTWYADHFVYEQLLMLHRLLLLRVLAYGYVEPLSLSTPSLILLSSITSRPNIVILKVEHIGSIQGQNRAFGRNQMVRSPLYILAVIMLTAVLVQTSRPHSRCVAASSCSLNFASHASLSLSVLSTRQNGKNTFPEEESITTM